MIIYQNRAWILGCTLCEDFITPYELPNENQVFTTSFFTAINLNSKFTYLLEEKKSWKYLNIQLNQNGIIEINNKYSEKDLSFISFELKYCENGLLNVVTSVDYKKNISNLNSIYNDCIVLIKQKIDDIFRNYIIDLTKNLETKNIIKREKLFYFGIPEFLKEFNIKNDDVNIITNTIVKNDNVQIAFELGDNGKRTLSYQGGTVSILPGNNVRLLCLEDTNKIDIYISTDFFCLTENLIYKNAQKLFEEILNHITHKNISHIVFRNSFNYLNKILINKKYNEYHLNLENKEYLSLYNQLLNIPYKYKVFKDAEKLVEDTLKELESEKSGKIAFNIQLLLTFIAGLTLFSVLCDFFQFLSLENIYSRRNLVFKLISISAIFIMIFYMMRYLLKKT